MPLLHVNHIAPTFAVSKGSVVASAMQAAVADIHRADSRSSAVFPSGIGLLE